ICKVSPSAGDAHSLGSDRSASVISSLLGRCAWKRRSNLRNEPMIKLLNRQLGGWVYIMCNMNNSTLYVGVTSNLPSRVYQHKHKIHPHSFTSRYNCVKLVYYKFFETIIQAIEEEKRIKGGNRQKKEELIDKMNPAWNDLYEEIKLL
ncbi:MAG TPA: GIY-YIG nuclease family protein, partial [Acidobacteriota bacterium]